MVEIKIGSRLIGEAYPPFVIAEIGINHGGDIEKAICMVDDAHRVGCECVKFQCHIPEDEMIPNQVVPGNTTESIWDLICRCALPEAEDIRLKEYVERKGMIYLSTPFSRQAAFRLHKMDVSAFKIGSGECNNYPLVELIARFGCPVILSTGMNDLESVEPAVEILRRHEIPFALLHCRSIYPTPPSLIGLNALKELRARFPDAVLGYSDHSLTNYPALASIALGASILERHFSSDMNWPGPDIPISMDPEKLHELIEASRIVHQSLVGNKVILPEEEPTIRFAYACVVTTRDLEPGDSITAQNTWVKRPGTGEISARDYQRIMGRKVNRKVGADQQLRWEWMS